MIRELLRSGHSMDAISEADAIAEETRQLIQSIQTALQKPGSGYLSITPATHMALSPAEQSQKQAELRKLEKQFIKVFKNPVKEEAEHEELLRKILATIEHYLSFYYDLSGHNFLQSDKVQAFREFLGEDPDEIEAAFRTISAMSGGRRLKKSKRRATGKKSKKSKKTYKKRQTC